MKQHSALQKNKFQLTKSNRTSSRSGKFLFNQLFGLAAALTGGGLGGGGDSSSEEDDDDDGRAKNCTCGEFFTKCVQTILISIKIYSQSAASPTKKTGLWGDVPRESTGILGWPG